jgi:ABC-type transport system involved in cytochrome c biogenesis permease component
MHPVIERELRVALRKHDLIGGRMRMALVGVGVSAFALLIGWSGLLHTVLLYLLLMIVLSETPRLTLDVFAEDRRNGTLGLLFLTGMTVGELFLTKVVGASLVALQRLLALMPFVALPFLMGGVSFEVFLATVALVPVAFATVLAVCLFASAACRDPGAALGVAVCTGLVLCLATPLLHAGDRFLGDGSGWAESWLVLSPAYAPYALFHKLEAGIVRDCWISLLVSLGWATLFVGLASGLVRRSWREQVESADPPPWRERLRAVVRGTAAWRKRLATRWLTDNPFVWLAIHDRGCVSAAWATLGGLTVLWLAAWWLWPVGWPSVPTMFLTACVLNLLVNGIVDYAAARRLSEDRASGTLELLLTTPLPVDQIVEGQARAMAIQFGPVVRVLFLLNVLLMAGGLAARDWNLPALVVYCVCWGFVLKWAKSIERNTEGCFKSVWIAVNAGRPGHLHQSYWTTNSGVLVIIGIQLYLHGSLLGGLGRFPTGSTLELVIVGILAPVAALIWAVQAKDPEVFRMKLLVNLREIAQEPVPEPDDPRLAAWNLEDRLPGKSE